MVDPINYAGMLTQLNLAPLQQGLAQRRDNRAQEAQVQNQQAIRQLAEKKFTQEQEDDVAFQEWLKTFGYNPNSKDLLLGMSRFPAHAKALEDGFKTYTAGQQQDIIRTTTGVLGALHAGNRDLAIQNLTERRDALKRAGVDTSHTDAAVDLIRSDDPTKQQQGRAYLAMVLTGAIGGEAAAGIMEQFGFGPKAQKAAADAAFEREKFAETKRHNRATEGVASERVAVSRAKGAGGGGGKSGGGKKGSFSDAQLDALLQ